MNAHELLSSQKLCNVLLPQVTKISVKFTVSITNNFYGTELINKKGKLSVMT
jgi:hypothetical protein